LPEARCAAIRGRVVSPLLAHGFGRHRFSAPGRPHRRVGELVMLMSKPTEGRRGSVNLVVVVIELIGVFAPVT
jgi:hypothetical protein